MTDKSRVIRILEAADWPPPSQVSALGPMTAGLDSTAGRFTDKNLSRVLYLRASGPVTLGFDRTIWGGGSEAIITEPGGPDVYPWVDIPMGPDPWGDGHGLFLTSPDDDTGIYPAGATTLGPVGADIGDWDGSAPAWGTTLLQLPATVMFRLQWTPVGEREDNFAEFIASGLVDVEQVEVTDITDDVWTITRAIDGRPAGPQGYHRSDDGGRSRQVFLVHNFDYASTVDGAVAFTVPAVDAWYGAEWDGGSAPFYADAPQEQDVRNVYTRGWSGYSDVEWTVGLRMAEDDYNPGGLVPGPEGNEGDWWSFDLKVNGVTVGNSGYPYSGSWTSFAVRTHTNVELEPGDVLTVWCTSTPDGYGWGDTHAPNLPFTPWYIDHVRIRVKGGGIIGP